MNYNFEKLIRAAITSGLGLWTAAMPAKASTITQFGESVQMFNSPTVAIPGGGNVLLTYANVAGNFSSTPGITINSNDPNATINFSPNPALLLGGLTNAMLGVTSEAGTAAVSGSLATGATHLTSTTADEQPVSEASVNIGMIDGLTFHVLGGGSANVTLTYALDGNLGFGVNGSYSQAIRYEIGSANMGWTAADDSSGGSAQVGTGETAGFTSFTYTNDTPSGFQFQGTFTVTDGEALQLFFAQNMTCGGDATCDFENTGQMGLMLPTGTSFTSNSGVFLTQTEGSSTPEPGSLLLMGLGMTAIGCVGRHRLNR
jgi:hypothetical protein